jgi:hypothetical protein
VFGIRDPDSEWGATAQQLGLALCERRSGPQRVDDMDAMVEQLVPIGPKAPSTAHTMVGRHRGHDVALTLITSTHTDSHSNMTRTSYATYAMARIDPPLLVGLKLDTRSKVTLSDLLSFNLRPDTGPQIAAFDPATAQRLLDQRDADGFQPVDNARALVAATGGKVAVEMTDNLVTVLQHDSVTTAPELGYWLDGAVLLAQRMGARSRALGRAAHAGWTSFARASGLSLDVERHVLEGTYAGVRVRLSLATDDGTPHTQVRVFFPRPLGLGFSIARQGLVDSIVSFFGGQDIQLGDPAFDDAFVIKGQPEDAVRQLLASPEARARLLAILSRASRLTMSDLGLDVRAHAFQTDETVLRAMLDDATAAVRPLVA